MFRTLISYLVLILVPVVSLVIAVVPYVWAKKKSKVESRKSESEERLITPLAPLILRGEHDREIASSQTSRNDNTEFVAIPLRYLWGAFFVGLVGNVVWWWIVDSIVTDRIALYIFDTAGDGIMLSFFLLSTFLVITPFIFYKLRHGHFTGKAIVYNTIISLITVGLVIGVWIVLAVVAYRGLFYQLN